jgi:hypothetical protein
LLEQHVNRAHRRHAFMTGIEGPSDAELRANIERRASQLVKRFNTQGSRVPVAPLKGDNATLSLHEGHDDGGAEDR